MPPCELERACPLDSRRPIACTTRGERAKVPWPTLKEAEIVRDEKKGDYYVARIEKPGRSAAEIVAEVVTGVMAKFPWPKSMRWGSSPFQWVRPLHSILCLLDGKVVPFCGRRGSRAAPTTRGHRFHGNETLSVKSFEDYADKLAGKAVMLNAAERMDGDPRSGGRAGQESQARSRPRRGAARRERRAHRMAGRVHGRVRRSVSRRAGRVPDDVDEGASEVLRARATTRRRSSRTSFLPSRTSRPSDGGAAIIAGNERVISARLSDAKFFWEQDLKRPLDEMANALDGITFHEKLGTQKERVERIAELAFQIAGAVDADPR